MRLTLTVMAGPHTGRAFTFTQHDTFIVGRSERAHFRLSMKDRYFSRNHFLIEVNPPHCRLMDLGSRNGTFLNGVRVTAADLHDGNIINAGQTVIQVAIQKEEAAASPLPETVIQAVPPPGSVAAGPTPSTIDFPARQADPGAPSAGPVAAGPTPSTIDFPARQADPKARSTTSPPVASSRAPATPKTPPPLMPTVLRQPDSVPLPCPACGAPAAVARPGSHPPLCAACETAAQEHPQSIAGYRMIRELGRGGMGVVDLAVCLADGRPVAVKTIIPQSTATQTDVARFLREASILRELDHPHIVAFRDMGESNGRFYFAMDYVRGVNASRLLQPYPDGLPVRRAVGLICQLLEALAYAHARQFVHRDIKPSNLLVEDASDAAGTKRELLKLGDFGLARMYTSASFSGLTMQGDYGGTFAFMPPEQITEFRESRPTNDVYAVGATLYNLLTGRYVYDFPSAIERKVLMLLQDEPVPIRLRRPDLPPPLAAIIHRSLAREPADRFASARAMQEALAPHGP
jgi:eukaryotic-like serine/threonine-protein kinase